MKLYDPDPDSFQTAPTTKLHEAAAAGDLLQIRTLLEAGHPIDGRDALGYTALMQAAHFGQLEAFTGLLDAGADPSIGDPLALAAGAGHTAIVQAWVNRGLDVNGDHAGGGGTPLMAAAFQNHADIVQLLVAAGAEVNAKDGDNQTALSIAWQNRCRRSAAILRQAGGIVDPADSFYEEGTDDAFVAFEAAAAQPAFATVLQRLTDLCGRPPVPFEDLPGVYCFDREAMAFLANTASRSFSGQEEVVKGRRRPDGGSEFLAQLQQEILEAGSHLIKSGHGTDGKPVTGLLFPTADKYAILAALDTNADNYGLDTRRIIRWLRQLEQRHPFVLTGCGHDYLEGRFLEPVRHAAPLARRMYQFCPDIVEQGCGSVRRLAELLEQTGQFCFWWD